MSFHRRTVPGTCLLARALTLCLAPSRLSGQIAGLNPASIPALTVNPAVIMVKAKPGQTFSQDISLWNNTIQDMSFYMEAQDVVVRDDKRVFLPTGEAQGSIARYAVFATEDVTAHPGQAVTTRVTVTVPSTPGPRAIACVFMGRTPVGTRTSVAMMASLGALMTFTVNNDYHIQNQPLQVQVDTDAKTITFRQPVTNTGSDPVVPQGVIAITNDHGVLVARLPVAGRRRRPSETSEFTAEHAGLPKPGKHKGTLLMQHESALFTNAAEFTIQ
jgi:hypothetical protein